MTKEQHEPLAVLLGDKMELLVFAPDFCNLPFEFGMIIGLCGGHGHKDVLVTSLWQLQLYAFLCAAYQFVLDLLAYGVQVLIAYNGPRFGVEEDMFVAELVIRSKAELVDKFHVGEEFLHFVFHRSS